MQISGKTSSYNCLFSASKIYFAECNLRLFKHFANGRNLIMLFIFNCSYLKKIQKLILILIVYLSIQFKKCLIMKFN